MTAEYEPKSLKTVFQAAEDKKISLELVTDTRSSEYRDSLSDAIKGFEDALDLVNRLSIFSSNESAEDISTRNLPYLLIHYHLAELIQKIPFVLPSERKRALESARHMHERFLHQLDNYKLLAAPYNMLLERYSESPATFSIAPTADPAARRNAKIAHFKAEKDLREMLDFLRRRSEYALSEDEEAGRLGTGDEEAVRSVHMARLAYCTHMVFQSLEGINREWEVLAQATEPQLPSVTGGDEDERRRAQEQGDDRRHNSDRLDPPLRRLQSAFGAGPILSQQGCPLQPFTLLNNRQELARGVFRPSHNFPTMTIDEYLEEEKRRGGIIEGGGKASGLRPEPDEDNIEKADMEIMKAREWDEFKEANARGAGNTMNRG